MATLASAAIMLVAQGTASADTVQSRAWHLDYLRIEKAHTISQGEGVVVAVIDSGVDATHPDLRGQVLSGFGIGSTSSSDGTWDSSGHGTRMAGLIAGSGGGPQHMLG